jgi:hypothetical protein
MAVFGHIELIKHVNSLWKKSNQVLFHYDTQYGQGPYYISTLAFRHNLMVNDPVIAVLFLVHEFNDAEPHEMFFKIAKEILPQLNTHKTVVLTDREAGIRSAIRLYIPEAKNLLCWFHMEKVSTQ